MQIDRKGISRIGVIFMLLIAIVLLAIILPAIMQVRIASQKVASMNNLRQLALSCLNYESAHMKLPTSSTTIRSGSCEFGWGMSILPFLEASNLASSFDYDSPWDGIQNSHHSAIEHPLFQSPLATIKFDERGYGLSHYAANSEVFPLQGEGKIYDEFRGKASQVVMLGEVCGGYMSWAAPGNCRSMDNSVRFDSTSFGNPRLPGAALAYVDGSVDWIESTYQRPSAGPEKSGSEKKFLAINTSSISEFSHGASYSPELDGIVVTFVHRLKDWREDTDNPITDSGLEGLLKIDHLKGVVFYPDPRWQKVTSAGIATIIKMTEFEYLALGNIAIDDQSLAELTRLKKLRLLKLSTELISDSALENFKKKLPGCEVVEL